MKADMLSWERDAAPDFPAKPAAQRIASGCAVAFVASWILMLGAFLLAGARFFVLNAKG